MILRRKARFHREGVDLQITADRVVGHCDKGLSPVPS